MKKMMIQRILALLLLALNIGHATQETGEASEKEAPHASAITLSDEQKKKMGVEIDTVQPATVVLTLSLKGEIVHDPDRFAHVIPKVTGMVKEAKKNIGSQVKAGESIAALESQEMADLKAAFLAAASKEKFAASLLRREESLFQKKISPEQDFLNAQSGWEEAHINLQLSIQKLQAFGMSSSEIAQLAQEKDPDLRTYVIYAPIDGTVLMRHLTQGEYVDREKTIYEIADLSQVLVESRIYPKDLQRLKQGDKVEIVNGDTSTSAEASLIYLSPTIDKDTIAAKAVALLDNRDGQWRPGLFVTVNIATDRLTVPIAIAKEGIMQMDGCDCAFVETEKGLEKREIRVGRSDGKMSEVLEGLAAGEKYVSKNPYVVKAEINKDLAKDDD